MTTVPTPITDKNGKLTTVHKNPDKGVGKNVARVAAVIAPTAKSINEVRRDIDAMKLRDIPTNGDRLSFKGVDNDVFVELDRISKSMTVYVVGVHGNPSATVTEMTIKDAKSTMKEYLTSAGIPEGREAEVRDERRDHALNMVEVAEGEFDKIFTPANVLTNAGRIYEFIEENGGESDSAAREALFTYAHEQLGVDYGVLYDKWMAGTKPEAVDSTLRDNAIELMEISPEEFDKSFTPELILKNADNIYDYMRDNGVAVDSASREAMYTYAAATLGIDYDVLYDKWMSGV